MLFILEQFQLHFFYFNFIFFLYVRGLTVGISLPKGYNFPLKLAAIQNQHEKLIPSPWLMSLQQPGFTQHRLDG